MAKKKSAKQTLVLLDVHAILHRAYHALPDFSTASGEPTGALYGVCTMLLKIIEEFKPDYIAACYDLPGPTFRHEAYDEYKGGRKKTDDALVAQIKRSRDIFEAFNIPMYDAPGFEADDMLGTIVEQVKKDKNLQVIIASGDMDTLQLVNGDQVVVYTLKKGINDTVVYNEAAVKERFGFDPELLVDYKGLRGDPSDNIVGIAGVGEKTATTLITHFGTLEKMYKALHKSEQKLIDAGVTQRIVNLLKEGEEEALFSKTLATIRRDAPITYVMPETSWGEGVSVDAAAKLFSDLEFRTMSAKLRQVLGGLGVTLDEPREQEEAIPEDALRRARIALWVLDSDRSNASLEDILAFTGKESFAEAAEALVGELTDKGLERVYYDIELPLIPILDAAKKHGVLTDVAYLENLSKKHHKELEKLANNIWKAAGEEFNINSPKQLGEILFDKMQLSTKGLKKTAGGARSTRESELVKLAEEHEIIGLILSYRELQKLLSTYIDTIPAMVDEKGRLHSTLHQTGTTTGRMSSSDPNMQNIPAREGLGKEVRKAFIAPKGSKLVALDYSQIEMRILAVLSKDENLIKVFQEGGDVHAAVASRVFGVKPDAVTKDMRRQAKVINFGIIYGMGVTALRENLGGTRKEAQEFYNNYFEKFPAIADYFEEVKSSATRKGYTETLFGRRRYMAAIKSPIPYIRAAAERMAMNAPIQGTAADLIKLAMIKVDKVLKQENLQDKAPLLLQIHDELIFEVKEAELGRVAKLVKQEMEGVEELSVPLLVDINIGESLGDMEVYKID